jgi:N-acetylglucosaminyldiphosphoundecaprenol N-acetyl-beta-D-mannosaminyltransferase
MTEANFLGLHFLSLNHLQLRQQISEIPHIGTAYHLVNAYTTVLAAEFPEFHKILQEDFLICDGKPLAHILKKRDPRVMQVRGADLMRDVLTEKNSTTRHFFLGSTNEVIVEIIDFARERNPAVEIAGFLSPVFKDDFTLDLPGWIELLKKSQATIVWVGLGTPKQDYVVNELAKSLSINAIAVGAAFDYLSGRIGEAPSIFQKMGLEWLYRLLKEPKRLARRYLVGNVKFVQIVIGEYWNRR